MSEHDLLRSVEQARHELTTLRACLESKDTTPGSPEIRTALGDLLGMLEKLQIRYGLLCEILARTGDAVFAKDRDGRYLMINRRGAGMFGQSVEQILGQDDTALFDDESAGRIMAIDREVMSTGAPQTFEGTFVIRGVPTVLLTTETAWYEPRGILRGLIGSAQDLTEQRHAERMALAQQNRLRSLASEIVLAEERLRQVLASELHDGLGQDIALTKLKLSALRTLSGVELHNRLTQIELLVEQADRSLRSITYQLSPPSLHDLGLVPALHWLAEDLGLRYGLEVWIEDEETPPVTDVRLRVILFRAVRELLVNAATHAETHSVRVGLTSEGGRLHITVTDEGAGFDASSIDQDGYGLFGIREQMKLVGGSMHLDSVPGRGTTVGLTTPLAGSSAP